MDFRFKKVHFVITVIFIAYSLEMLKTTTDALYYNQAWNGLQLQSF